MESEAQTMESTPTELKPEPAISPIPSENKQELANILSEARNTKAVLDGFIGAIRGGRYDGSSMLDLAKGLAFLDAIRNQNIAHIKNLQERVEKSTGANS